MDESARLVSLCVTWTAKKAVRSTEQGRRAATEKQIRVRDSELILFIMHCAYACVTIAYLTVNTVFSLQEIISMKCKILLIVFLIKYAAIHWDWWWFLSAFEECGDVVLLFIPLVNTELQLWIHVSRCIMYNIFHEIWYMKFYLGVSCILISEIWYKLVFENISLSMEMEVLWSYKVHAFV
jgi:hypothetical protein